MALTREDVERTASLARLRLTSDELDSMTETLSKIFQYIDELHEVNTDGIEPLDHVLPMANTLEADSPHTCLDREEALKGAPDHTEEFFRIPRVIASGE